MSAVLETREPSARHLDALKPPLVQHFALLATAPGGATRLRKLILALAVQGKLVPQDLNDEPASELLRKIRAEKDRLVAAGKIKRDKVDPAVTEDEAPFTLGTLTDSTTPEELATNWQRVADHFDLLLDRPAAVDALEQTILQLAVRGLLVPQFANDEPASLLLERIDARRRRNQKKPLSEMAALDTAEAPYELPNLWTWAQLGDLVENMGSGWSPACEDGERTDPARWAVLRTTAVQVMEYRAHEHKAIPLKFAPRPEIEVQPGDVLVTRAGPMNRVGISCWVDQTPSRLMLSDKIVRFHPVGDELSPAFLVMAMNAGWTRELLEAAKTGMAASQVNVSQSDLKSLWVPVCSRNEQARIVARVKELRSLCADLRQRLTASQTTQSHLAEALVDEVA